MTEALLVPNSNSNPTLDRALTIIPLLNPMLTRPCNLTEAAMLQTEAPGVTVPMIEALMTSPKGNIPVVRTHSGRSE